MRMAGFLISFGGRGMISGFRIPPLPPRERIKERVTQRE
jgi:hypothetical protein